MRRLAVACVLLFGLALQSDAAFLFSSYNPNSGAPVCWSPSPSTGFTVVCATTITNSGSCGPSGTANGTCYVAVSTSTGSDTCSAYTTAAAAEAAPCKTLNEGMLNLRQSAVNGWSAGTSPDQLLLKSGDTFLNEDFGYLCPGESGPGLSGVSATQPLLISSYGTGARPIVEPNPTDPAGVGSFGGGGCSGGGNNVAIIGIKFYNYAADPNNASYVSGGSIPAGTLFLNPITWMLIEDCIFDFGSVIIEPSAGGSNVSIRRSEILDVYPGAGQNTASGMFIAQITNLLIQENLFDNNGWNASASGAGATVFNHNIYLAANNGPATIVGNILSNDASGSQFRTGGTITDNTFIASPYGHNIGQPFLGLATLVNYNVHLQQKDNEINGGDVVSTATISNFSAYDGQAFNEGSSATFSDNVIAHSLTPNTNGQSFSFDYGTVGTTLSGNIACDWKSAPVVDQSVGTITALGISSGHAGSGYTNGNYAYIPLQYVTSGAGSGAMIDAVVSGGAVTSVALSSGNGATPTPGQGNDAWSNLAYTFNISSMSGTASPYTVNSTGMPGFFVGNDPTISGAAPSTLDGSFTITSSSPGSFVATTSATGTWSSGGTLILGISNGGALVSDWPGGTAYSTNDLLEPTGGFGGGSGLEVKVSSVSSGVTLTEGTGGYFYAADCNHNSYTDPNRSPGSYYATLSGATANATFTGVIVSGVLTISGITGTVSVGDAITWSGQTSADFIKSFGTGTGGNGSYNLAGTESVGSGAMSSYTTAQPIAYYRARPPQTYSLAYSACGLNQYIMSGFGLTNPCTP